MGSDAMMYIQSAVIASGIRKLTKGDTKTHRRHGDRMNTFCFFPNEENGIKINNCN
jgi:hypothetical protein